MNRYLKVIIVVIVSAVLFFFLALAYFDSQIPSTPGGIPRYDQLMHSARSALVTAKALDCTLVYIVVALIIGIWRVRRR